MIELVKGGYRKFILSLDPLGIKYGVRRSDEPFRRFSHQGIQCKNNLFCDTLPLRDAITGKASCFMVIRVTRINRVRSAWTSLISLMCTLVGWVSCISEREACKPIYMILYELLQQFQWCLLNLSNFIENLYHDDIISVCILCDHQLGKTILRYVCPRFDDGVI